MIFLRWRLGEERVSRSFGPLPADHWAVQELCPACGHAFDTNRSTVLLAIGPGEDPESQAKHASGRWYNAVALMFHTSCLGLPDVDV